MNYKNILISTKKKFEDSNVITLASSSSFFFILTFVPTVLLLVRLLGSVLGENSQSLSIISKYISFLVPQNVQGVVPMIKNIIQKPMFASGSYTFFNLVFLAVSSLGFFNSIWRNLTIITEDSSYNTVKKYVKGLGAMLIAFAFLLITFFFPMISNGLFSIMESTPIMKILETLKIVSLIETIDLLMTRFDYISYILISIFMIILFKYILFSKVKTKSAAVGAILFTISLALIKSSFYLYANLVSQGLLKNYGASYIIVLMYIWVFVAMVLFYSSIILCLEYEKESRID